MNAADATALVQRLAARGHVIGEEFVRRKNVVFG